MMVDYQDKEHHFIGDDFGYLVTVEQRSKHTMTGKVYDIVSLAEVDGQNSYDNESFEPALDFYLKWDGCCHIQTDTECMTHLCGMSEIDKFAAMVLSLKTLCQSLEAYDSEVGA